MWVKEWKVNNLTNGLVSIGRIGGTLGRILNFSFAKNQHFPISAPVCTHRSSNSQRSCQLLLAYKITNTQQTSSLYSMISAQIHTPKSVHLLYWKQRLPKQYAQLKMPNSNSKSRFQMDWWVCKFIWISKSTDLHSIPSPHIHIDWLNRIHPSSPFASLTFPCSLNISSSSCPLCVWLPSSQIKYFIPKPIAKIFGVLKNEIYKVLYHFIKLKMEWFILYYGVFKKIF